MKFKRIYLLYLFGFLINFRPVDPFIYDFYVTYKKFSAEEVNHQILPILSYSSAGHLSLVFLLADICGYKALILISAISAFISTCARIWVSTLVEAKISEVFRGISTAAEVSYYIFIYGHYDVTNYQRATAYVQSFALLGKASSAFLVQLGLSKEFMDYEQLHYLTLGTISLSAVTSFFLPTGGENIYHLSIPISSNQKISEKIQEVVTTFKINFIESFNNKFVILWSIWSIFSIWSFNQVSTFIQPLWEDIHQSNYNGAVEATLGILSLSAVLLAGFKKIKWTSKTNIAMALLTGLQFIILLSGITWSDGYILFNYSCYVIFGIIHYFVITAISAEIAKATQKNCFGLVFGFVHLVAMSIHAIMVSFINDGFGWYTVKPKQQFFLYYVVFNVTYVLFFVGHEVKKRIDTLMTKH